MANRVSFRWLWFWVPVILAILWLARCAHGAEAQLVATPRARALAVSATNRPFLAADRTEQPVALAPAGYSETEYLVSGVASVYDWTGNASGSGFAVRAANLPYTTRMLLRRPTDARKASGLVIVELLDAGDLYDRAPLWGLSSQQFLRHGDVWVGVTVRPAAAAALRRFDPVRYGDVSFAYHQAADCHAPRGEARAYPPDTETGLAWDVIAQVGALLRSSSKENPLLDLNPRVLIAAGHGEAGAYVTTFANAMHAVLRRGDGAPIYDGYLSADGMQLSVPINQCSAPLPVEDPRRGVLPRDVPFVTVMTESDFNLAAGLRRADSDAPEDTFRLYEIPGAVAAGPWPAGQPAAADLKIAGFAPAAADACAGSSGAIPGGLAFNAIWQQYAEWFTDGHPMLSLPRIETLPDGGPRHDEMGNASGGWRLPQLEVPLAVYSAQAAGTCGLGGSRPLEAARLKRLYRDRAGYLRQLRAAVDRAVQERRLVREDGEALKNPSNQALPAF
jgi:hypothetical protein